MYLLFILVLFFFVLVFYFVHLFLYFSAVRLFQIKDPATKTWLFYGLSFLAVAFFVATLLTRYTGNQVIYKIYYLIALWSGTAINLVLAAVVGWLIYFILKYFRSNFSIRLVAILLLVLAVLTSTYGVINARQVRLVEHEISIAGLPASWSGRTIVHLTDAHLGAINRTKKGDKMVELINSVEPDLVLVTGDYFDGTVIDYQPLVEPLMNIHSKLGTFFVIGNHETYISNGNLSEILNPAPIKWLRNEVYEVDGVNIIGIDYPSPGDNSHIADITAEILADRANAPSILLFHEPIHINELKAMGIDFFLAGHTHAGQQFPINLVTRFIYGKYHHGFYSEDGFNISVPAGAGTWGPPLRIGNHPEIFVFHFK